MPAVPGHLVVERRVGVCGRVGLVQLPLTGHASTKYRKNKRNQQREGVHERNPPERLKRCFRCVSFFPSRLLYRREN